MTIHKNRTPGFTVIELLIVIIVIGILVTITLIAYSGAQSRAIATTLQNDLSNAAQILKLDNATDGSYPTLDIADSGQQMTIGSTR